MTIEGLMIVAIPLGVFLLALWIFFAVGKAGNAGGLTGLGLLWAGFCTWMLVAGNNASGLDGIGYAIGLIFVGGPVGLGGLLGGIAGWRKREPIASA